jgi:hypothetical protein
MIHTTRVHVLPGDIPRGVDVLDDRACPGSVELDEGAVAESDEAMVSALQPGQLAGREGTAISSRASSLEESGGKPPHSKALRATCEPLNRQLQIVNRKSAGSSLITRHCLCRLCPVT